MPARIYKPARNAMQSGQAKTRYWVLEFPNESGRDIDPLMGWTSTSDALSQVRLRFESREEAEDYARENGIDYIVTSPHERRPNIRPGGYGDNFSSRRRVVWTH